MDNMFVALLSKKPQMLLVDLAPPKTQLSSNGSAITWTGLFQSFITLGGPARMTQCTVTIFDVNTSDGSGSVKVEIQTDVPIKNKYLRIAICEEHHYYRQRRK
jgi:hypothetical protein